jgi:hypothetical protein
MLEGSVYKFAPSTEIKLDASLGRAIQNIQDKSLRSKFYVEYLKEVINPTPKTVDSEPPSKKAAKRKSYTPKRTRQESIV